MADYIVECIASRLLRMVAFGQVRVEIIFSGEDTSEVDLAAKCQSGSNAQGHSLSIDGWQCAGLAGANRADGAVRLFTMDNRASAKELGFRVELDMAFNANHGLSGGQRDSLLGVG